MRAAATLELRRRGVTATDRPGARSRAARDPKERRRYAGDPWAYFADIFGVTLTRQQTDALDLLEAHDRVLLPSGNNLGKTFTLAGYGVYRMDAVAALPDDDAGLDEQGCRLLLPGPDHKTIFATVFSEMLALMARAETRGHLMPGERSDRSVLWKVRPKWEVEPFSPAKRVQQEVAHTASGRHHRNQIALVEEGQGVEERLWKAVEGMCSSAGNKIASSFNPTEPVGPAYQRATGGGYAVLHLDAFGHPNVATRTLVVPDAVDFKVVDDRVRNECRDRGAFPDTQPDEERGDFLYALPPDAAEERGARDDDVLGHPDGAVRVYRPTPAFTAQVRGGWPRTSDAALFDPAAWDEAVRRWRDQGEPDDDPDRVGADPAREGDDETVAVPAWGEDAETVLRAYLDARDRKRADLVERVRAERRVYVGAPQVLPKGKGPQVAQALVGRFGTVPYNVDDIGVGSSPLDHMTHVMQVEARGVSVSAAGLGPIRDAFEPHCQNLRTSLYVRAAKLVNLGLADVPDDALLREELMAHEIEWKTKTVDAIERRGDTRRKTKKRVASAQLLAKDDVKQRIGRSPDRAEAFVLALFAPPADETAPVAPVSIGRTSPWRI